MFKSKLTLSKARLLKRIWRDFFQCQPVGISINTEGYYISPGGSYILGMRAGPSIEISHLLHEMGHLAEREIDKLLRRPSFGWGYYPGKPWSIHGQSGFEPQNNKGTLREARVAAFQLSLCRHYGVTDYIDLESDRSETYQLIDSFVWLTDWGMHEYRTVSADERKELGYEGTKQWALHCLAQKVEQMSQTTFNLDVFRNAWFKRMEALSKPHRRAA